MSRWRETNFSNSYDFLFSLQKYAKPLFPLFVDKHSDVRALCFPEFKRQSVLKRSNSCWQRRLQTFSLVQIPSYFVCTRWLLLKIDFNVRGCMPRPRQILWDSHFGNVLKCLGCWFSGAERLKDLFLSIDSVKLTLCQRGHSTFPVFELIGTVLSSAFLSRISSAREVTA